MVTMNASGGSTDNTGNRTSPDGAQADKVRDREATKPTAFLEVEARFAAPEEAVAPSFGFVPGVAGSKDEVRELSAMYLDTEDLRLTRAKHTLRRRTGGPDEGWHLKAPKGSARLEYGSPLDAGAVHGEGADAEYEVPADLLAPVRSIVRSHKLGPIARVDNERHVSVLFNAQGEAIAEFCDDHVTAVSLLPGGGETKWREWEVELLGDMATSAEGAKLLERVSAVLKVAGAVESESPSKLRTALGDSIEGAPVPPSPADLPEGTPGRTVVDALAANVAKMVEWDPKVRNDEWDSVHQMRVATRELRSHMQTFHGILVGDHIGRMESELKLLAGVLGVARDAEVVAERFEKQLQREEADVIAGEMRAELLEDINQDYARAHRRVVAALNSDRYLKLLDDLDELLADPPVNPSAGEEALAGELSDDTPAASDDAAGTTAAAATDAESVAGSEAVGAAREEEGAAVDASADQPAEAGPAVSVDEASDVGAEGDADDDADDDEDDSPGRVAEAIVSEDEVDARYAVAAEEAVGKRGEGEPTAPAKPAAREKTTEELREEINAVLGKHLEKAYRRFEKRHRSAVEGRDDRSLPTHDREERFHDVRKAAKRLRYSAEAAASAGLPTKKLYAACKTLQSSLGDFQDTCTAREVLLQKSRRSHAHGHDTFGYGVLYQIERMDGLEALQAYDDDVKGVLRAYGKLAAKVGKQNKAARSRKDRKGHKRH